MGDEASSPRAELTERIQNDAAAGAAELFEKYSQRVYYIALRELRSHADAEDVRAETFLRVFRAIQNEQVRSAGSLSSYIIGTARNVILETLRSPHRAARERDIPDLPSPQPHPMLDEDVRRAIEATIHRMKPKEREFVRLHYYEDLTKEEIARRIGIDEERVRLVKHRSLKSFREIYQRLRRIADTKGGRPSLKS